MEFKGTKGEWYVVGSEPSEIATDKKTICFVGIQDYFNKDIEQRANAKLIAAAPKLLEACIMALQAVKELHERQEGWHEDQTFLEVAINKALK